MGSELTQLTTPLQGLPLQQPHEVRAAADEVEVLSDRTRQHHVRRLTALQGALPAALDCVADLAERPFEHRAVELSLAAEEIGGRSPGDSRGGTDFLEAGRAIALRGEQSFGRVEDRFAATGGVPPLCREGRSRLFCLLT